MTAPNLDAPINTRDLDTIIAFLPLLQALDPNRVARWPALPNRAARKMARHYISGEIPDLPRSAKMTKPPDYTQAPDTTKRIEVPSIFKLKQGTGHELFIGAAGFKLPKNQTAPLSEREAHQDEREEIAPVTVPRIDAPINPRDVDAILAFLPRLQALDPASSARWPEFKQTSAREFLLDRGEDHPLVTELIKALYDHGLVRNFDWPKWKPKAEQIYERSELLKKVTMKTCVKLLTLHARTDHFMDRHFAAMVQSGHISAILNRMSELRRSKNKPPHRRRSVR